MSKFDLLFLAVFLATVATLCVCAYQAMRARGRKALAILAKLVLCWAAYVGIVILVSLVTPRRVIEVGEDLCWDDWCLAVANVSRETIDSRVRYVVDVRITSRARRRAQRGSGSFIRVIDDQRREYNPVADATAVPLDVLLQPQQTVHTTRTFELPADARTPVLVLSHGSGFPGILIIGDSASLFHEPTVVELK